ncbi:MAG: hypothetical protein V2I41_00565 [Pseudomonadales bacterium]|jgi:hypothetical protein|nr:hypothetical protein [Pseudomonadales bacterium]
MTTLIDARFNALRDQGYTGSTSDMLLQWLKASGATSNNINDAWYQFLSAEGYSGGHRNDSWYAYLRDQGYQGSLSDMELAFWVAGGAPGYGPELVVNGGFDTDTAWGKGTGWSIANGVATYNGAATQNLSQDMLEIGKTVRAVIDVPRWVSGRLQVFFGVGENKIFVISDGGQIDTTGTVAGNTTLYLKGLDTADFDIDNVSVKEVL